MKQGIRLKRIYEPSSPEDGMRILVDRVWPRGVSKADAALDHWVKDIAPSTELRKWFGHRPDRWAEFKQRYAGELDRNPEALAELRRLLTRADDGVTLLFAAQDVERNNAEALRQYLASRRKQGARQPR